MRAAWICSQFLSKLSREIRTPLNSVSSVSEMLLDTDLTASQREFARTYADSASALAEVAQEITEFANFCSAQSVDLKEQPYELSAKEMVSVANHEAGNLLETAALLVKLSPHVAKPSPAENVPSGEQPASPRSATSFATRVPAETSKLIRILVAEDNLVNQRLMLRMLAKFGYSADAVANGAEAVAALNRSPYDLILMDCQMPELDGYEATRQIRRSGGRFKCTPIIAVTANAIEGDREKCLASGMDDYLSKPVLAQTLATTLEKWIMPAESLLEPIEENQAQENGATSQTAIASENLKINSSVDPEALEALRAMDSEDQGFMEKIIDLFLLDMNERLATMGVAAKERNTEPIKKTAHALKGSCGHFGAERLASLCRKMEQVCAEEPMADPDTTFHELAAEAARVRIALLRAKKVSLAAAPGDAIG